MKLSGLSGEVCGSSQLIPAYVNNLQALAPFQCLDSAGESIKEYLVRMDHMSLRAWSLFVVVLEIFQGQEL